MWTDMWKNKNKKKQRLVNQHNICVEDSKAIRLLIFTRINSHYDQT